METVSHSVCQLFTNILVRMGTISARVPKKNMVKILLCVCMCVYVAKGTVQIWKTSASAGCQLIALKLAGEKLIE